MSSPSEVVRYILEHWVDHVNDLKIAQTERHREIHVSVTVHPEDYGKVIGKDGRIIEAIKMVVSSMGAKLNRRITLSVSKAEEGSE